ncbi:nitroreductase/quinone reductase family protein [Streptomyces sp. NPDC059616]|uniref:nitroreductase/quinone reductase family protein n=1 Tax=Streptomyces sp. NPDC059616 TaxID=3346886 RepID=UPI003673E941
MATRALNAIAPHFIPALDRALHRFTGGRSLFLTFAAPRAGLILTTTGARSGQIRRTPLLCAFEAEQHSWLLVGSNFGKAGHPGWSANLKRHPDAAINWRGDQILVHAAHLAGQQREAAWTTITEFWPPYAAYQTRTAREIRVFRLTRR